MAKTNEPLLDLDTLTERPTVRIDGVDFELRTPGELNVLDFHRMGKYVDAVNAAFSSDDATNPTQRSEQILTDGIAALEQIMTLILLAPVEVVRKLKDVQKLAVMQSFMQLGGETPVTPAPSDEVGVATEVPAEATTPTGEN